MKGEVCTAVIAVWFPAQNHAGTCLSRDPEGFICKEKRERSSTKPSSRYGFEPRSRRFYLSLEVLIKGTDYFRLLFVCLYFIIFNEFINPEVSGKACTAMPAI
ncbi:MAG: hypothetical protein F4X51_22600 [Gemmatimonadetes bacterium]|nr:hypothetical protein [Gemmatimonadota bacterium]